MRGVLGIIEDEGRLLMIRRSAFVRVPLAWCFPGGEIERGETEEVALVREMHEELGLRVEAGRRLMTQTKHHGRLVLYCWSAIVREGPLTANPREISDFRWMTGQEIRDMQGVLDGTTQILDGIGW